MGRLANIEKAGFYPFAPEHYFKVAAQLASSGDPNTWMLDPCAGEGLFAGFLAHRLGDIKLATIEINTERGLACRKLAQHHVTSDALQVELHKAQFSLIWSNPPFMKDHELRLEWKFLRRFLDALAPGGILAYTIPQTVMTKDHHILRHLVEFYEDHRLYYLPDPNPYRQIILFARKRAGRVKLGKAGTRAESPSYSTGILPKEKAARAFSRELLTTLMSPPLLPDTCDDPLQIPVHPRPSIVLRGTHVDWDELRAEAVASPGPDLGEMMVHPGIIEGPCPGRQGQGRSLMPPRRGHVASLMAGGGLDNTRVGDEIIKGYVQRIEVKQKLTDEQILDGVAEITRTEYEPMIARFNPSTSEFHAHTSKNGLGDFLANNAADLSQALIETLEPAYDFDIDSQPDYAQHILKNMAKHMQVPGKPAGLWPGQRHVGAALDIAFRSPSPLPGGIEGGGLGLKGTILVAEMGWGKTLEAAAQFALYYHRNSKLETPKPSWAITEPHLVDEMAETIKSCYPKALVTLVTDIAEVQRFIRLKNDPIFGQKPRIAVLSKELFKGGSGFRCAVITDRRRFHGHMDDEGNPLLAFRCPDCGRLQVISHKCKLGDAGRIVTHLAYFRQRPRRCCYDVITTESGHTKRLGCGAHLYQQARAIGTTGIYAGVGQNGFKGLNSLSAFSILAPSRPGLVRMPIADYIARLHPDQVGLVIWDEAHAAKGESTDTGHALASIAQVADHVLLMTGTLFGGTASSVFHLAYRISPHFRKRWRWNQLQAFVERYGVLEKKTVQKEVSDNRGSATTKTRITTHIRELPGCSPALVSLFLGFTIFTGLSDLGISLPPLKRRIIHADPDSDHAQAYEFYADACKGEMKHQKDNDVDLAGSLLHTLRGHAVAPWRPEYLKQKIVRPVGGRMRHTYTRVYLATNSLEWTCAQCGRPFLSPTTLKDEDRLRCHHCDSDTSDMDHGSRSNPASFLPSKPS
ncbi:MAG: methyltransferase [Chloroflexi bacterium]|nr:methyltransferase [Chloroflexota bacterium]